MTARAYLLPQPRTIRFSGGHLRLNDNLRLFLDDAAEEVHLEAVTGLLPVLHSAGINATIDRRRMPSPTHTGDIALRLRGTAPSEGYRLLVTTGGVQVEGRGPAGLFYGIQTLGQLLRQFGARLPLATVDDKPAFAHRGFYLDVTRGKVPTLQTLKGFVDRLSALKINQFQLYVEHAFDFSFDPRIGEGVSPLLPGEILELDAYCRERFIDFVPSLACFGHMGRILSIPSYRDLAEIEWSAADWNDATWRERLRGATINPRKPRSRKLLMNMLDEYLPLFKSPHFNACCDETYDLGRGANAHRAGKVGVDTLYLDHIVFLREIAARHGKRLMFWGDVMLQHKDSISRIPRDCIVLDWGYARQTPFKKVEHFVRAGLEAYVCPSTRGYQVVFNQVEEARANIAGYARAGKRSGADGLLTTDWGDMGHFNMSACSLHGQALGAAMAWNPDMDEKRYFDKAFSLQLFGDTKGTPARLFREMGTTRVASWPLLVAEFNGEVDHLPRPQDARVVKEKARQWMRDLEALSTTSFVNGREKDELVLACRALKLNAEKTLLMTTTTPSQARRLNNFADELRDFTKCYASTWIKGNKPSGVDEVRRALMQVARQAKARAGRVLS